MNVRTRIRLWRIGYDKTWLDDLEKNWTPRRNGKYKMVMYDIDDLGQEPEEGRWIETTTFSDERELNRIHKFFEGLAYVMTVVDTGDEIGRGIIDGSPFDEVSDVEGEKWWWR